MATCTKDHTGSIPGNFDQLVDRSQAKRWRHICAGCAYELGVKRGAQAEERLRERVRTLTDEVDRLKAESTKGGG